ncbi:MAG TPA: 2-oxoacid:ferredoxin oxidoreductase subunit beta [Bacteroidales bacterium]|nr:2-oxoacid:ferredoxin oxidoreductase subunit beta [Bacteroidales bacterium]
MDAIYNSIEKSSKELTKEDFQSGQMVKWCPGCGAHVILASILNTFPKIGYNQDKFVFVSGIGCSSRFPYYINTYGFHGIHGRASAIATGVKLANPGLSVWVATGDGDSLAIGGNHFMHAVRRNIDLNIILFNNQIYGLTKGQFSPTSPMGSVTKTSPFGTIEPPVNPGKLVLGVGGSFFARVPDNNAHLLGEAVYAAAKHDGTSVVEVLQNCIIFNDKAHEAWVGKEAREENMLVLEHGKPMLFGKNMKKGLMFKNGKLLVVEVGKDGVKESDILVHDMYDDNPGLQIMLIEMAPPHFPVAVGIIRAAKRDTYDDLFYEQIESAKKSSDIKCVDDLLNSGTVFEIR